MIIGKTDHKLTIKNKRQQPTMHSKRDVAITNELQPSTNRQTARKLNYEQPPECSSRPIKSVQPKKPVEPKKKGQITKTISKTGQLGTTSERINR